MYTLTSKLTREEYEELRAHVANMYGIEVQPYDFYNVDGKEAEAYQQLLLTKYKRTQQ